MKKTTQDIITMLVIMALSFFTYTVVIPWQIRASAAEGFTNRTFPRFTMSVIFLAATAGLVEVLLKERRNRLLSVDERIAKKKMFEYAHILPFLGFAVVLCYGLLFWYISIHWRGYGFVLSTAIFIPVFLLLLRCKKWQYYVSSYAFAIGMYLIFRFVLKVMLR